MNLKESALGIFRTLQSDPVFEHAGRDSRSIVLPTQSFVHDLRDLARDTLDPFASAFLTFTSTMSESYFDEGVLVRIKNKYSLEIRGADSSLPDESNLEELYPVLIHSGNKIIIDLNKDSPFVRVKLFIGSNESENDSIEDSVNNVIDRIPVHAEEALINGILGIINRQVDQIVNS
jgi:hypothetical protein